MGIRVDGIDRLLNKLKRLDSPELVRALQASAMAIAEKIRDELTPYPPPPRYPLRWASEKQRRYVMSLVRRYGPWRRGSHPLSQDLANSYTVKPFTSTAALLYSRATYAVYVQSAQHQQPFHRDTGWTTDKQAIERVRRSGVIRRILHAALRRFL